MSLIEYSSLISSNLAACLSWGRGLFSLFVRSSTFYFSYRALSSLFRCLIIELIKGGRAGSAERRCSILGASGSTRGYIFRKVELILSSAYYAKKLFRFVRRILKTTRAVIILYKEFLRRGVFKERCFKERASKNKENKLYLAS